MKGGKSHGAVRGGARWLRDIIDADTDGVLIVDAAGIVRFSNPAARLLLGTGSDSLEGQAFPFPLNDGELEIASAAGAPPRITDMRLAGIQWEGRPAILASLRDITGRKRLEAQLSQAQKMEALGQLAGGVAHDFNNLLTIIGGYGDLLRQHIPEDGPAREYLDQVRNAQERAAALTRQLLAFSRRQVLQPRVIALNAAVAEVTRMLRPLLGPSVHLMTRLEARPDTVRVDPNQLHQVLLNLALNARDAMPNGGTLLLKTENVAARNGRQLGQMQIPRGAYILAAVADTGTGMSGETQARIFEPFFTTKAPGQGTGLGLSTVYGIVQQSGGYLWVESEPGRGSTFYFLLPFVDEAPGSEAAEPGPG